MKLIPIEQILKAAWGDSRRVERIVIKMETGFFPAMYDDGYKDRLVITPNSISYVNEPRFEHMDNYRWSYKTMSLDFTLAFIEIAQEVEKIIRRQLDFVCCDGDHFIFTLTYEDGSKESRDFWASSEDFEGCFSAIRKIIPQTEELPDMILSEADYDEDNE